MKKIVLFLFFITTIAHSQIVNIPDANFKAALVSANSTNTIALTSSGYGQVDTNNDGEIQYSEALLITGIQLQSLGIIDLTGIESFINITFFGCYNNSVNNFELLNGLQYLQTINVTYNTGTTNAFNFSNLPALTQFGFTYSNTTSLVLDNLDSVINLSIWGNSSLTNLNLIDLNSLDKIAASDCNISTLSITNSPVLKEIDFTNSNLNSIAIANFPLLKKLKLGGNNISDTSGFTNINNIEEIIIQNNQIATLVLPSSLPFLKTLMCGGNGFSTIDISGYPSLLILTVNNNNISSLDFSNTPLIQQLNSSSNPITTLDLSNLNNLVSISCSSNFMTELDFSNNPNLTSLSYFNNPNLTFINLKSGTVNTINYNNSIYYNLPNLFYICIDEGDAFTYSLIAVTPTVQIGSFCSFTPGGNYNTITGDVRYDYNQDGCDVLDPKVGYARIDVNLDGTSTNSSVFSNSVGDYNLYTSIPGTYELIPNLENPSYFTISPNPAVVNIPVIDDSTTTQNFCITANGVHPDLEIVIAPIIPARPGFEAEYQIVYKNKGNQVMSQVYGVNFFYNQNLMSFVSATQTPSSIVSGGMSWDFANLMPLESRSINVVMLINAPTATNPVNIGDVLQFTSSIMPMAGDELTTDNLFQFNQTVVGSYDPNDITCIEGDVVAPSYIGEYMHYVINFENTGTAAAENVVVKIEVNPNDFDINSLRILESSHNATIKITNNILEIIFQTIMLDTGGHGNVLLKVKSKENLVTNDIVTKSAKIYFDYNFPILTNDANTTFQVLSNSIPTKDVAISLYPNPTSSMVNIKAENTIKSTELYDVQGRLIQINKTDSNEVVLDISIYNSGIYFIKVTTDVGSQIKKIVKE